MMRQLLSLSIPAALPRMQPYQGVAGAFSPQFALASPMVPFHFSDVAEARTVARLLRRQAQAFQLLASRIGGDEADRFIERAREAIAIASRVDTAADLLDRAT
jgi:hypothetical protein